MNNRQREAVNGRNASESANEAAALHAAGRLTEAVDAYRRVIAADGGGAFAFSQLCSALTDLGRNEEALGVIEEALARYPDRIQLTAQRGVILERLRRYAEAVTIYEQVLQRDPALAPILNNLAGLLNLQGRHDEAVDLFRRSLAIEPNPQIHSNLLFVMNYSGRYDQRALFTEHKCWARHYAPILADVRRFPNPRDPARRLRIGYISADFRMHPVAFFIGAIIAHHDRNAFEVFCYSATFAIDEITNSLQRMNVIWRDITALDDEETARLIRRDGIDILVDLSGHTAGHRLSTLARCPAPIQASYLGYPNTTGMEAIGYRFTDAWADPPGLSDATYTEKLVRLPHCFVAYTPPANLPSVGNLPAFTEGCVTFGSFNNLAKVSPEAVVLWSQVLAQIPDSRLMIKGHYFADSGTRELFHHRFSERGVIRDRLLLLSEPSGAVEHYEAYNRVDIALDTTPYNGTTTTCEALWMGVPVIALAGERHASRVGASLLNAAGLPELIAQTPDAYVAIARGLAQNLDRLAALRGSLRSRMSASPLLDTRRLTRELEASYRALWQNWCADAANVEPDGGKPTLAADASMRHGEPGSGAQSDPQRAYSAAVEHYSSGRLDQAEAKIKEVLSKYPDNSDSLCLLGAINMQRGHYRSAVDVLQQAIALHPNIALVHNALGVALRALGELDQATTSLRRAISLKPDLAEAHNNLGIVLKQQGHFDDAIRCYHRALELNPVYAEAHNNLGNALRDQGKMPDAMESFCRAISLKPNYAAAHSNLGTVLFAQGRLDDAIRTYRRAIELKPDYAEALANLGLALHNTGYLAEAERVFRRAIALQADFADAHAGLALVLLALGDFKNGWCEFEWRWNTPAFARKTPARPLWKNEPLNDRTILLRSEQGFGDTIQFLRYAPLLGDRAGRVIVQVPSALVRLAATVKGCAKVVTLGDPMPAVDFYCPLLSMPERLGTMPDTIPGQEPYLSADPALVEKWSPDIAADGDLKVGVAWAGNPKQMNDRYRSIGLETLMPLLEMQGVRWFSLQVGERASDVARLSPGTVTDLAPRLVDFAETAAVMAHLDLVLTIDSAAAHLAGALGRPVWVMVSALPDWRYPLKGERSAWYSTMRVFRQAALGDWNAAILRVRTELAKLQRCHGANAAGPD